MDIRVGADGPVGIDLLEWHLRIGFLVDLLRIAHVVVLLECLRTKTPELSRLLRVLFAAHDYILLDQDWHLAGIFSRGSRTSFELRFVLLPCLRIGNEPIRVLARPPHRFRTICRHQQGNRLSGWIIQPGIHVVVLTFMVDHPAPPQVPDHICRLDEPLRALLPFWPGPHSSLLIQRLPRSDPKEYPSRIQQAQGSESLCYDCWVVPKGRTRNGWANPYLLRALSDSRHRDPCMSRMAFIVLPWLKMIARSHQIEPGAFGSFAKLDQSRHRELFMRQHESDQLLFKGRRPARQPAAGTLGLRETSAPRGCTHHHPGGLEQAPAIHSEPVIARGGTIRSLLHASSTCGQRMRGRSKCSPWMQN